MTVYFAASLVYEWYRSKLGPQQPPAIPSLPLQSSYLLNCNLALLLLMPAPANRDQPEFCNCLSWEPEPATPLGSVSAQAGKRERATSVALLLNRLSDRRFVAFEYHRVGLSGRRICLRPSSSSLAGTFFGWALTLLTTPNFLCRCLEHCPCMPLQIPGSWTLVRTVWNYRED